ncbi:MAG: AsmA family protein, partial [Cyclobacteriaceae bacterium]|nr:AsmA family protein [Cyclobacteriaceae bacterium]
MKKAIKVISIGVALLIITPIITLFVLSKIHHHSTHQEIVEVLNQELDGKIVFEDFNFSYLKSFPRVHAELIGITIHDSNSGVSKIGKLDILLNLKSLWKGKLEIEKFLVNDAFIYHEIDSLGNKPQFFSSKKKSVGNRTRSLVIESHDVEIINSQFYLGNMVKGNRLFISVQEGIFNLAVTDSAILISGNVSAKLDTLISNHMVLFTNLPASVKNAVFKIDKSSGEKELVNGIILAHTLELTPRIKMTPHEDGQLIDLHISGEGNFDTFLELFEFHTGFDLKQTNPQAKLSMSYNQHGIVNPFLRPYSELDFAITNSEFSGSQLPYPVKNFSVKGNYNNGEAHSPETTELVIDTLHAEVSDSYVNGRFKLNNLKDPIIDAHLISEVNLSHLIKENENFNVSGTIDLDLILDGKISELKKLHLEGKQVAKGTINVRDLNLTLKDKGYKINLLNGSTILNNHILEVTTLVGAFNESAFHFQGVFDNLDQFISNENEELSGKVNLNFERLDLNEFNIVESSENADTSSSKIKLPMIALDLSVTGKEIISDMGVIHNFRLNSIINTDNVIINSLAFNYQEGEVKGYAGIFFRQGEIDSVAANITGKFDKLNFEISSDTSQTEKEKQPFSIPTYIYAGIDLEIDEG